MIKAISRKAYNDVTKGPVARQSKQVIQRQSAIHPMVEQCLAGKLMSSPKPPAAGARRARLYSSLPARHHNCRMQLSMDEAHQRQWGLIDATDMVLIVAQQGPLVTNSCWQVSRCAH
jgi:hypothetical protein